MHKMAKRLLARACLLAHMAPVARVHRFIETETLMGESIHSYEEVVPFPVEQVWSALHRTADLDLQGGLEVFERVSDSEWTTKLQNRVTRCSTLFDEEHHRATVTMKVDVRRSSDTAVLTAAQVEDGTRVSIDFIMRANVVLLKLSELIGAGAYENIARTVVGNVKAICQGLPTHIQSQEQLEAYARARVDEHASR
jgi:hypothetical protein